MSTTSDIERDSIPFGMSTVEIQKEHPDEGTDDRKNRFNGKGLPKCSGDKTEDKKQTRLQQYKIVTLRRRANEAEGETKTRLVKMKDAQAIRLASESEENRENLQRLRKRNKNDCESEENEAKKNCQVRQWKTKKPGY